MVVVVVVLLLLLLAVLVDIVVVLVQMQGLKVAAVLKMAAMVKAMRIHIVGIAA